MPDSPMPDSPSPASREVAERAFELLRDGEWIRHDWGGMEEDSDGATHFEGCLTGAIRQAAWDVSTSSWQDEWETRAARKRRVAQMAVQDAIAEVLDEEYGSRSGIRSWRIVGWNDILCPDKETVLEVLKKAVVRLPLEER